MTEPGRQQLAVCGVSPPRRPAAGAGTAGKAEHIRVSTPTPSIYSAPRRAKTAGSRGGFAGAGGGARRSVLRSSTAAGVLPARYRRGRPGRNLPALAWRAGEIVPGLDEILAGLVESDLLPAAPSSGWKRVHARRSHERRAGKFCHRAGGLSLPLAGRCAAQADVAVSESVRAPLQQQLGPQPRPRSRPAGADCGWTQPGEMGDPRFDSAAGRTADICCRRWCASRAANTSLAATMTLPVMRSRCIV